MSLVNDVLRDLGGGRRDAIATESVLAGLRAAGQELGGRPPGPCRATLGWSALFAAAALVLWLVAGVDKGAIGGLARALSPGAGAPGDAVAEAAGAGPVKPGPARPPVAPAGPSGGLFDPALARRAPAPSPGPAPRAPAAPAALAGDAMLASAQAQFLAELAAMPAANSAAATGSPPADEPRGPAAGPGTRGPGPAGVPGPERAPGSFARTPRRPAADPGAADYREAAALTRRGRLGAALPLLERVLERDPRHRDARLLKLAILGEVGDEQAVEVFLIESNALFPAEPRFAMPYARLLAGRDRPAQALSVLEAAAPAGAGDAAYQGLLAAVASRAGQHEGAAAAYRRALAVEPGRGDWWLGLALALQASGDSDAVPAALERALADAELDPELAGFARRRLEALGAGGSG